MYIGIRLIKALRLAKESPTVMINHAYHRVVMHYVSMLDLSSINA